MTTDFHPNRRVLEALFAGERFQTPEFEYQFRTDDFVAEIPQSGERIEGRDALLRLQQQFERPPGVSVSRISGAEDFWVVEALQTYDAEGDYHVCVLVEFRGGKISREVRYYGPPLERARE